MYRDKPLRILLVLFGLIFVAGVYPLFTSVRSGWQANKEVAEPMAISLDVTMGIFLLLAAEPKQRTTRGDSGRSPRRKRRNMRRQTFHRYDALSD